MILSRNGIKGREGGTPPLTGFTPENNGKWKSNFI